MPIAMGILAQPFNRARTTPANIEAIWIVIVEKFKDDNVQARNAYIRSIISAIKRADGRVCILGEKTQLAAALSAQNGRTGKVPGFVHKWCAICEQNH